jgi:hypothetical protein
LHHLNTAGRAFGFRSVARLPLQKGTRGACHLHVQAFEGLPQPAHALFFMSFPHFAHGVQPHVWHMMENKQQRFK